MPDTMELHDGTEVDVEHITTLEEGARFQITADDGRRWRVDVQRDGTTEVVTSWRDGELADLEMPDWLGDVTARLARA